ncbi:MAG: hypothetical protein C5S40_00645 [ANME-2 cluster archaeon]|nr:hypothetical protein [ANME-2 cluster archaeon]
MTAQIKSLNQPGDYYYCSSCSTWHILKPDTKGQQHLLYFDEAKTNAPSASYYFCTRCMKWHKSSNKADLPHRAHIISDGKVKLSNPPATAQKLPSKKEPLIGGFDGADGLWKSFDEHLNTIGNASLRQRCMEILEVGRSLEKEKVQCFSRKDGFSFIIRGLKVAQVRVNPAGFSLTLIKNIHNSGRRSVRQEKSESVFSSAHPNPLSDSDIRAHLLEQSQTLLALRRPNTIGYMEKWLHCLLVGQMSAGGLPELGLDFLYYETPVGKVKRNRQFGREHVDIVARERSSGALVVVEVKKDDSDLKAAIVQGMSYVDWMQRHRRHLVPRVQELGWDVDMDKVKLYVIAPGDRRQSVDCVDCDARVVLINRDWYVDEKVKVIYE